MTPADELHAAAERLRSPAFKGAQTLTATVAALLRARGPLADWLDLSAEHVRAQSLCCDNGEHQCSEIAAPALVVARAILGSQPASQEQPRAAVSPCMCGQPDDEDVHHPTDGSDCRSTSDEPIRDWVADMLRDLKQP